MDGHLLLRGSRELREYLKGFHHLLGRRENRQAFDVFVQGQLSPVERKSLEPIADLHGLAPRSLQKFFSQAKWNDEGVLDEFQARVAREHGHKDAVFVVDETSDGKKGEYTAGVQRQYCGESGKIENCIVSVHLAYAHGDFQVLLDGDLFLPESWNPDPENPEIQDRRKRAGIPEGVGHVPKTTLALRQLERARRNGLPGCWVTADEGYGDRPPWRRAVAELGYRYVVEVSPSHCTRGWCRRPRLVASKLGHSPTRTAPSATPPRTLDELREARDGLGRQRPVRIQVKNTHKGPEVWEFQMSRFWQVRANRDLRGEAGFHYDEERLLVGRNLRTGEVKYFVSNDLESSLEKLVEIAFHRWHVERCFQDCKQELGLNHAEIRSYRGLHRHFVLTAITYYFVQGFVRRHRAEKGGPS